MEHEERLEDLESGEKELEERRDELQGDIDEARGDWESKKEDSSVPGAQPDEGSAGDEGSGAEGAGQ